MTDQHDHELELIQEPARRSSCMVKLDRLQWKVHQKYEIAGLQFWLRTSSESLGDWIAEAFRAHRVAADDHPVYEREEDPLYSVDVADPNSRRPGKGVHALWHGTKAIVRTMDLGTLQRAIIEELARLQYPDRDDAVYLDSMLLASNGNVGLAPSGWLPSLARVRRRADRAGLRLPVSRSVAVDLGSGKIIPPDLGLDIPASILEELPPTEDGLAAATEPVVISSVMVPWTSTDHMFHQVSPGRGVYELSLTAMNLPLLGTEGLEGIKQLVEGAGVYETIPVQGGDFIEAAAALLGGLEAA